MPNFLRGWRRKLGVVTLLLACVFAGGWVRSQQIADGFYFPNGTLPDIWIASTDQSIVWRMNYDSVNDNKSILPMWGSRGFLTLSELKNPKDIFVDHVEWIQGWCGFSVGVATTFMPQTILITPYWSIVIPLTLLSARLLLSKPRVAKETKPPSVPS